MIEARGLGTRIGTFEMRDITFEVPAGAYGVVIGPAGSGKTTLLEAIAGVGPVTTGTLRLGGRDARGIAPEARALGLVYQEGYLFPHLTVDANVRYGARDEATVADLLQRFDIGDLRARPVHALSGGERQLVALVRTLARRPSVVLLDEPFSALDPRRRAITRREVRSLHREWGLTTLQVTHDFTEAGLLGDVAILLDRGRVLQYGSPEEVFRRPASPYIAEFLGAENVFAGEVRILADEGPDWLGGEPVELAQGSHAIEFRAGPLTIHTVGNASPGSGYAVIRAEEIVLSGAPQSTSARNVFRGRVSELRALGAVVRVTLDVGGVSLVAAVTSRSAREMGLREGVELFASFKAMAVHLC